MKFNNPILSPNYLRHFDFDSAERTAPYLFECSKCKTQIKVDFQALISKAFGWEADFSIAEVETIEQFFDMNAVGKSPDGGWRSVVQETCSDCLRRYLIYAGVNEYQNSLHRITLQGIVEIEDE